MRPLSSPFPAWSSTREFIRRTLPREKTSRSSRKCTTLSRYPSRWKLHPSTISRKPGVPSAARRRSSLYLGYYTFTNLTGAVYLLQDNGANEETAPRPPPLPIPFCPTATKLTCRRSLRTSCAPRRRSTALPAYRDTLGIWRAKHSPFRHSPREPTRYW